LKNNLKLQFSEKKNCENLKPDVFVPFEILGLLMKNYGENVPSVL